MHHNYNSLPVQEVCPLGKLLWPSLMILCRPVHLTSPVTGSNTYKCAELNVIHSSIYLWQSQAILEPLNG